MRFVRALGVVLCMMGGAFARAADAPLPMTQDGGSWDSGHVQGIAVDRRGGYIYYSFTNLLVKYDFAGNLVGTLAGWSGHLGDLDFNSDDGRVYGSLEYKAADAFLVAVIDGGRIVRPGMTMADGDILRAISLPEAAADYAAEGHRYGASGIDGVAFGPAFGTRGGQTMLTVAYGIFGDTARRDNDHQILLQYDAAGLARLARPLDEKALHRLRPARMAGKYFVRTGNTRFGVQNLAYDPFLGRWFMGVYAGEKPGFPNYLLFAVDAEARPRRGVLVGVDNGQTGMLLPLADDGLRDPATGIRGWWQKADVGFQPMGGGFYYIATNARTGQRQTARLTLMCWTGDAAAPFAPALSGCGETTPPKAGAVS